MRLVLLVCLSLSLGLPLAKGKLWSYLSVAAALVPFCSFLLLLLLWRPLFSSPPLSYVRLFPRFLFYLACLEIKEGVGSACLSFVVPLFPRLAVLLRLPEGKRRRWLCQFVCVNSISASVAAEKIVYSNDTGQLQNWFWLVCLVLSVVCPSSPHPLLLRWKGGGKEK